jgi:AmpD protein
MNRASGRRTGLETVSDAEWFVDGAHRLQPVARQVPSPNCNERPDPEDLSLVVVHAIALPPETFGGPWIDALFTNRLDPSQHPYFESIRDLTVSAHLCIFRDGSVTQYVPIDGRAWHAGLS